MEEGGGVKPKCEPAQCTLFLSYLPQGDSSYIRKGTIIKDMDVCSYYQPGETINCLTDERKSSVRFADPVYCLVDAGNDMLEIYLFAVGPIVILGLVLIMKAAEVLYQRAAHGYRARVFLLSVDESRRHSIPGKSSLSLPPALAYSIQDYQSRSGSVESPTAYMAWTHRAITSFSSLCMLVLSLGLCVLWLAVEVSLYTWVVDHFQCQTASWEDYGLPLVLSVAVSLGAWFVFLMGCGGLAFTWVWIVYSQRYLVVMGRELLLFRTHWLFGEVYRHEELLLRGESEEGAVITSTVGFETSCSILFRCRWHALVKLTGEGKDNFIHTITLTEDYDNAQRIHQWVTQMVPS